MGKEGGEKDLPKGLTCGESSVSGKCGCFKLLGSDGWKECRAERYKWVIWMGSVIDSYIWSTCVVGVCNGCLADASGRCEESQEAGWMSRVRNATVRS